jgi:hypothetical protein
MYPIYYAYKGYISDNEELVKEFAHEVHNLPVHKFDDEADVIFDFEGLLEWCKENCCTVQELIDYQNLDIRKLGEFK